MAKKAPKKTPARKTKKKQTIRSKSWKRSIRVSQEKFDSVSKAVLKILGTKGMGWGELVDRVQKKLPKFEGALWWHVTSTLRELETQGKILRLKGRPVTYSKKKR